MGGLIIACLLINDMSRYYTHFRKDQHLLSWNLTN